MRNKIKTSDRIKNILVVEDSLTQAAQIKYLLEDNYFDVVVAYNGNEALAWLSKNEPSLIISDIMMPGMNGFELCEKIKSDDRTKYLPVILLTSLSDLEEVIEGLSCGADSFITKPYDKNFLISNIEKILVEKSSPDSKSGTSGVEINYGGKKKIIRTEPQKMVKLLLSIYQGAIFKNNELIKTRDELRQMNERLEELVEARTTDLKIIESKNVVINYSIQYAQKIQSAVLKAPQIGSDFFGEMFYLHLPRDTVSGDFYWFHKTDNKLIVGVFDCTGHGVPGAFMSTLGISSLDEIITNNTSLKANTILNLLREKIKTSLHQTGKQGEANDGMDVAFCILHKNRKKLEFSGAYNPLFIFRGGVFREYRADRMPIGIYYGEKESFTNYEIDVQKGDTLYIFSDGFADQFGGPKGSKYMKFNLKKLLSEIYNKPMDTQRIILETEFEKWKGSFDQIDDVTILGIRI